jgi:pentose-5-phosphate-3-epimerase
MKPVVVVPSILAADLRLAIEVGADAIVAGSAVFGSSDYAAAIKRIRNCTSRRL